MTSKISFFWIIWLIFILYSFLFAPSDAHAYRSTHDYVKKLVFGQLDGIDTYIISLFYIMGIWPLIYLTILLIDGQYQTLNGTLAALLSNFLGAWIILPYLALRRSEKGKDFKLNIFIRIFESKIMLTFLTFAALGLLIYAFIFGDLTVFIHEFRTNWFIHIMTIDFFVLSFVFPYLIKDDLERRQKLDNRQYSSYFRLCFIPLFGPLIYFYQRPLLKHIKN